MKKQTFRLQTKEIFMTYPQCGGLEIETLLKDLTIKLNTFIVEAHVITKELHEDGNPHLHVYIKTKRMIDIKNQNFQGSVNKWQSFCYFKNMISITMLPIDLKIAIYETFKF
jgi:hypothetical protein